MDARFLLAAFVMFYSFTVDSISWDSILRLELSRSEIDTVNENGFLCLKLGLYRNQILDWFVCESMLLLCLQGQSDVATGK